MSPTLQDVDAALAALGDQRLVSIDTLPDWLDTTGARVISEHVHEGALRYSGEVRRFIESPEVIDRLLDRRNELDPPIHVVED